MSGARACGTLAALLCCASAAGAQWSPPQPIFSSSQKVQNPVLVADSSGGVHVFFVERGNGSQSARLMYLHRDERGWSEPVVVLAPNGLVESPSAAVDPRGWLHVVYAGPSVAQLEYRRVHVERATDLDAWSRPQELTDSGVFASHIVATPDGVLHVVYASRKGNVYYIRSTDAGRTWSDPAAVSAVEHDVMAADGPDIAVDGRGRLHVVWTEFFLPKGWPPAAARYSRSVDDGQTWSPPLELAGQNHGLITVATRGDDEVHAAWNGIAQVGDRDHAWSADGGATWSAAEHITTAIRGGWTGATAPIFDSAGTLHVITSVDGPNSVERIFHLDRTGTRWSAPELASGGTVAEDSVEFPSFAISGGNHLHVAYEVDFRQIWYTDRIVDAPALPPQPVPTFAADLGGRLAESSPAFRVFMAIVAAVILAIPIEFAWRRVHWRLR